MCGRLWQVAALQRLIRNANAGHVRNSERYQGTYNMAPTNFIPALRRFNNGLAPTCQRARQHLEDKQSQQNNAQECAQQITQDETKISIQQQPEEQQTQVEQFEGNQDRVLDFMHWGMQTEQYHIINIRAENPTEKPLFKPYLQKNRCVVMAQGYYDWDPSKNAHSFKRQGQEQVFMAAIYTNDEHVMLLTREAVGDSSKIHHRMPVLLEDDEEVDIWLDTDNYTFEMAIEKAMRPEKKVWNEILTQRLGPAVNNVREKSAKCIMSYEDYQKELDRNGIKRFFQPKNTAKQLPDTVKNQDVEEISTAQETVQQQLEQDFLAKKPAEKRRKLSDAKADTVVEKHSIK